MLKKSHIIGDKAPTTAHGSNEVASAKNWRRYPHTCDDGHILYFSSSSSLLVGFSNLDETMGVDRSEPQKAPYHADAIMGEGDRCYVYTLSMHTAEIIL